MKLSDDLKKWRADRPDEWTMDRFIAAAIELEERLKPVPVHDVKEFYCEHEDIDASNGLGTCNSCGKTWPTKANPHTERWKTWGL